MHDIQPSEGEGINTQLIPFANLSDSESKYEDQDDQDIDIENEFQADPNLDMTPAPNPRPKWAQKVIEAVGNSVGDPSNRRRKRSKF